MTPKHSLVALALLALAACDRGGPETPPAAVATDGSETSVSVLGAWCRPTPEGAQAGACYLTIEAAEADRLVAVATPAAVATQIHDMTVEDGVMRMSEMEAGLPLPAGQAVTLAPGGKHLMLTGLTSPLVAGERIPLTLGFDNAPAITVRADVRLPIGEPVENDGDHDAHAAPDAPVDKS